MICTANVRARLNETSRLLTINQFSRLYHKVPKVTTLITFGFSSLSLSVLSEGRYFQGVATFRQLKGVLHMGRFYQIKRFKYVIPIMHATVIQKRKEYFLKQNVTYIICLKSYVGTSKIITIIKNKPQISLAYRFISIISIIFSKKETSFQKSILSGFANTCEFSLLLLEGHFFWGVITFRT